MIRSILVLAALFMASAASAQSTRDTVVGVSRNSTVWAGPDDVYPRVAHVRAGDHVWLHGCLRHHAWCDISFDDGYYRLRGWIPGKALFVPWHGQHYPLNSQGMWLQFPYSNFDISLYWGRHYSQFPWYRERYYFDHHDWRRDRWRWDHYGHDNDRRNWDYDDVYRERVIDERRQLRDRQSSGRDRDGLTPLQRQIQLQSERARQLQERRNAQERREQAGRTDIRPAPRPEPTITPRPTTQAPNPAPWRTPLQERIQENTMKREQPRMDRQVEP